MQETEKQSLIEKIVNLPVAMNCKELHVKYDDVVEIIRNHPTSGDVESVVGEKLHNMMLAHLDGVYKFSARENCDELVTQLIQALTSYQSGACIDEGCPHYGKNVKCEPKDSGCIATYQLGVGGGWLPIESAPRDGRFILVAPAFGTSPQPYQVYWHESKRFSGWMFGNTKLTAIPTRWMELPAI